jgi:hypothetical protein
MDTREIGNTCPFCGTFNTLIVNEQEYLNWQMGDLIQDAFKSLNADEREIIKTGICASCWPSEEDA